MLHDVFMDPAKPYDDGGRFTVQVHSALPDPVPIGHFKMDRDDAIVDELVSRAEYLERIQQSCRSRGDALTVRFYDHSDDERFDASVLDALDEIQCLSINVLVPVVNAEAIGRLPKLTRLNFSPAGRWDYKQMLRHARAERLTHVTLSNTETIDLSPLADAQSLQSLRLLSQGKNTEAIGACAALKELSIHPSQKFSLAFVNKLHRLEVLKFSLGTLRSLEAVGLMPSLRDLSFDTVAMLEDLGDLQRFPNLRRLQIDYQKRLKAVRVGAGNVGLEHINVSSIDAIEGFAQLPALKSLFSFAGGFKPEWGDIPPSVTHFALMPRSLKAREKHAAEVRAHKLIPEQHPGSHFFYK